MCLFARFDLFICHPISGQASHRSQKLLLAILQTLQIGSLIEISFNFLNVSKTVVCVRINGIYDINWYHDCIWYVHWSDSSWLRWKAAYLLHPSMASNKAMGGASGTLEEPWNITRINKRWTLKSLSIWVFPKIMVFPPNHPLKNRVFHHFHHPFWGKHPYFWKHPISLCFVYHKVNDECFCLG